MVRPTWEEYYMLMAKVASLRATCPRASCGVVLVDPNTHHVIATGYNGSPPGEIHCIDEGCLMVDGHCQRAIHAEVNAVTQAARRGASIEGAHAYVYGCRQDGEVKDVCRECSKVLRAANIEVVICAGDSYFQQSEFMQHISKSLQDRS